MSCAPGNNSERVFSYNGLTVLVSSNDPSHLTWLEEFMSPHFGVGEGVPYHCKVSLTVDTERYREIQRRGGHLNGEQVDCFALDSNLVWLPLWSSATDDKVIFDKGFRTFYVVSRGSTEIDLVTPANNMMAVRIALMRVVRELAMNYAQQAGCLVIHGSAFVVGGGGTIIAGPKRAGKTTLLVHVLRQDAAKYLSNDRVVVSFEETGPVLYGMPTIVTVRQQMLEMFPELRSRLLDSSYRSSLTLGEANQRLHRPIRPAEDGRFFLSPAQFCELLGASPVARGQVRALVFPRVTGQRGTIEIEQLSAHVAAVRMIESLFSAGSAQKTSSVFALSSYGSYPTAATLEHLCVQLTSRVRCFECRLGKEAYQSEASAAMFVRSVMG